MLCDSRINLYAETFLGRHTTLNRPTSSQVLARVGEGMEVLVVITEEKWESDLVKAKSLKGRTNYSFLHYLQQVDTALNSKNNEDKGHSEITHFSFILVLEYMC